MNISNLVTKFTKCNIKNVATRFLKFQCASKYFNMSNAFGYKQTQHISPTMTPL